MRHIVYVSGDDWMGVYIDGELAYQGHSMPGQFMLEVLERAGVLDDVVIETRWDYDFQEDTLPENASELRTRRDT